MQKTQRNIPFVEKARIFSLDYLKCCVYISNISDRKNVFTKRLYSKLISTSQVLEDFLDFHGAKNSKDWYFYRELTASIRHLCLGAYSQKHISNRLVFYDISDSKEFEREGSATLDFLTESLVKLAPVILDEAQRLNISVSEKERNNREDFPGIATDKMLNYDIDDEDKDLQKENIVKIASDFLSIADKFDQLGFYEPYELKEILAIVPDKVNEVEIRRFEMLVHNLQSSFDTYVIHGGFRFGNRKLKQLRSFFSVVFH